METIRADIQRLDALTEVVIGCAFNVLNTMGAGFLEKVYENALIMDLRQAGCLAEQQFGIAVCYGGRVVGAYFADVLVERMLLVEIKTVRTLDATHVAQCVNYLKGTGLRLCLLLNFGNARLEIKRVANGL